jgi:hypothetical protein
MLNQITGRPSSSYKTDAEKLAAWEQLVTVDDPVRRKPRRSGREKDSADDGAILLMV